MPLANVKDYENYLARLRAIPTFIDQNVEHMREGLKSGFTVARVALAWLLALPLGLGPLGVYIAVPTSFSVLAFWSGWLFRRGRWKEQKV